MILKIIYTNIYASILPIFGGLLGAIGGSGNKGARRILIPILIMGLSFLETENILTITILSMIWALSIGYGIPDINDRGSVLGRFWYWVFNHVDLFNQYVYNNPKAYRLANYFTRGTTGISIALSLICIPILKHNWFVYLLCGLGISIVNALISWRSFGIYKLFNKELSWVETITWGVITLFLVLIIKMGR